MRVLVTIASHGLKNMSFLESILDSYRRMPFEIDLVVLSDAQKELGSDIEVVTGAPTSDPRSLPFAHRKIMADRRTDYDLFIYSEDDTRVRYNNILAFLEISAHLPVNYLPGFMRYELTQSGDRSIATMHSGYHWNLDSVECFRGDIFASYSNDHAACYMLKRADLDRAIDSGGFLIPPHSGRYDMLVSAATDPYTRCGFRKVLCLSRIDDFLLHHLPNVYIGRLGIPESMLRLQIEALTDLSEGDLDRRCLLPPETSLGTDRWDMQYHRPRDDELIESILDEHRPSSLLSVGSGAGDVEGALVDRGVEVTAVPLDAVIARVAAERGVSVTPPDLEDALGALGDACFDVVLLQDVLHRFPRPARVVSRLTSLCAPGGAVLVTVPNRVVHLLRRGLGRSHSVLPGDLPFDRAGIHGTEEGRVRGWLLTAGCEHVTVDYLHPRRLHGAVARSRLLRRLLSDTLLIEGRVGPRAAAVSQRTSAGVEGAPS